MHRGASIIHFLLIFFCFLFFLSQSRLQLKREPGLEGVINQICLWHTVISRCSGLQKRRYIWLLLYGMHPFACSAIQAPKSKRYADTLISQLPFFLCKERKKDGNKKIHALLQIYAMVAINYCCVAQKKRLKYSHKQISTTDTPAEHQKQ